MVTNEMALTPFGAMMMVSTSAEERVSCPHCALAIELGEVSTEPGAMAVACPHCEGRSLLVRLVHVLHRAVELPGELWSQLQVEREDSTSSGRVLRMPLEVFRLEISRGAIVLLTMLWHQAERSGSRTIEASMSQLARRLLTSRTMVRRWLRELDEAGALQETTPDGRTRGIRRWELLPLSETEVDDAGR